MPILSSFTLLHLFSLFFFLKLLSSGYRVLFSEAAAALWDDRDACAVTIGGRVRAAGAAADNARDVVVSKKKSRGRGLDEA